MLVPPLEPPASDDVAFDTAFTPDVLSVSLSACNIPDRAIPTLRVRRGFIMVAGAYAGDREEAARWSRTR